MTNQDRLDFRVWEEADGRVSIDRLKTPLRAISVAEQIAEDLAADILKDRLEVGGRLGEEAIAARFKVSRGPVRSALRILERRGLAKCFPRRGFFVARPSPASIRDAIEIRFWLLVLAARTCARKRGVEAVTDIEAKIEQLKEQSRDPDLVPADFAREITQLYAIIVDHSTNPKLPPMLQETLEDNAWTLIWRHWSIDYITVERRRRAIQIFERLSKAIAQRDADESEKQARLHLEDSLAVFFKQIESRI
jgi:DNA-binding GntR family transcriptional regulator